MSKVEKEITVQAPVEQVYQAWHNFENFPQFMENIEEVRVVGGNRSHWRAKGPLGTKAEWDAEMTLDEPNEAIGWRSIEGNDVKTSGRVNFESEASDVTKVRVMFLYEAPAGVAGKAVTEIFKNPGANIESDLKRFKDAIEKGQELSGFAYGNGSETLGGSMGPTSERDLEGIQRTNSEGISPTEVDDPARRNTGDGDARLPRAG